MTVRIAGNYQDGVSSEARAADLVSDGVALCITGDFGVIDVSAEDLQVSDRIGATPRVLTWGTKARFSTRDNDAVDEMLRTHVLSNRLGWIARLESKASIAIAASVLLAALVGVVAVYGVPGMARYLASVTPAEISKQLGASTLSTIDRVLSPSELSPERQSALAHLFRSYGEVPVIEFRNSRRMGANALTLSATTVVMTDQLIALAENDQELLAVYLHELGHARLKHVEQSILQRSAWLVLFSVVVGDVSGAGELILSLPLVAGQMAYSRKLEREADQFAIDTLLAAGLTPTPLAEILEKLERSHRRDDDGEGGEEDTAAQQREESASGEGESAETADQGKEWAQRVFEYLSTHPATDERVRYIRSIGEDGGVR